MAALVDLILEVFRWKTTKRKQFFDSEIQSQIDAMGRHHEFWAGVTDFYSNRIYSSKE